MGKMTNGDVIKQLFPNGYFLNDEPFSGSSQEKFYIDSNRKNLSHMMVSKDWWNSQYKENKNE